MGRDLKNKLSLGPYLAGILAAGWLDLRLGFAVFVGVSLLWRVPDRRMEHARAQQGQHPA